MGIFGYPKDAQGNITPLGLAQMKATQKTLDPDSMQSRIARDRQLDRERAERRLAEEQRLRDMIQSMLPPLQRQLNLQKNLFHYQTLVLLYLKHQQALL